jgi:hypothetical protein
MSEPTPLEQSLRELAAVTMLHKGHSRDDVVAELEKRGVSQEEARAIVNRIKLPTPSVPKLHDQKERHKRLLIPAEDYSDEQERSAKEQRAVIIGGGMVFLGVLLTIVTYSSAVSKGGGQYTIYIGLIVSGLVYAYREVNRRT